MALLDTQAQEATKLFNEKKFTEAEALALKLLDLAPNQRIALRVLYELRKAQNKPAAAEALARRLAALPGPANTRAAANLQLAQFLVGQGRHAQAEPAAAAAVMAAPKDATAQHVLGVVLTETGRLIEGERHYRRALTLLGREDGMVLANTAWNLKLQGRLDEAAALYERALALRPENKRGVGGYAQVQFARGELAHARTLLEEGLARWENDRTLRLLSAMLDLESGATAQVMERLAGAAESLLPPELLVRGQAHARLGQPAEAVRHYAEAKKIQRERNGQVYQPAEFLARAEALKTYFTAERTQHLPRATAAPAPQPVFLLGFARSGTSLLEQLLAQLPGFAPADDMAPVSGLIPYLTRLAGPKAEYPEVLDQALAGEGLEFAEILRDRHAQVLARVLKAGPDIAFYTDRSESNAWHLGLIKLLYPEAPILHLLRHPYDVVLSVLAQDRKLEGNAQASLAAAAHHYALVMGMLKHYRANLTLRYLPLRYEALVRNPQAALRAAADFIGVARDALPPAEQLLANKPRHAVPAPAHFAVARPVHAQGLFRHRAYQAAMPNLFNDVRDVLAPWVEELGYAGLPP